MPRLTLIRRAEKFAFDWSRLSASCFDVLSCSVVFICLGVLLDGFLPVDPVGVIDRVEVEVDIVCLSKTSPRGVKTHGISICLVDRGVLHIRSSSIQLWRKHRRPLIETSPM